MSINVRPWVLIVSALMGISAGQAAEPKAADGDPPSEQAQSVFLRHTLDRHFVPLAARFSQTAPRLIARIESLCASPNAVTLEQARSAWIETMLAWEAVDAVEVGPLLDRRSTFRIDFWPTRPREVESIVRDPPKEIELLDRVNAPAKGLPAIELLLWSPAEAPMATGSRKTCDYAHLLARGVHREAENLEQGFRELTDRAGGADTRKAFSALINQTFGAVELLRGKYMLKPARLNNGRHFPRVLSGQTARAWSARWCAIHELLAGKPDDRSASLVEFLRGQGQTQAAADLSSAIKRAAEAMQDAAEATPATAENASAVLAEVETALANDVAAALKVTIGFHAYDGD